MKTTTVWKTLEIKCGGEKRRARLLTEWVEKNGSRELKGIICDHPKLSQEEPYDCSWSCWSALTGQPGPRSARTPASGKKTAPRRKAAPPKSRARRAAR